ncbi:hypothetical protein B0J11DRAFT_582047 [Dendryphion nanum]|uniref:Uncharacterized protein n=1 Tax=Dendryphion nanum TaxID=256645 RepID=A0A9P9DL78_9PLEO|nr:hypothetical protein B0J11DRAFT_582047 [Dendryphion nanum]
MECLSVELFSRPNLLNFNAIPALPRVESHLQVQLDTAEPAAVSHSNNSGCKGSQAVTSYKDLKNLKYIIKIYFFAPRTLNNVQEYITEWPGTSFEMKDSGAGAILGSPNDLGIGFRLAQHKDKLSSEMTDKITVFQVAGKHENKPPSSAFHVRDHNAFENKEELNKRAMMKKASLRH